MKIDRMIGILTILLQTDKVTAPELARRFEVSRRTIMRDIESLCLAGVPVATLQGGNGGIAIMDGYKINKNVLTTDEMETLTAALRGIDTVSKTSRFEALMRKLAPSDSAISPADSITIDLSSHYKDSVSEKIETIKTAIAECKTIAFDYYYEKGESPREIEPHCIQFIWQSWYVLGWCRLRRDFRRFKLNRLWELTITDTPFVPRPVPADKADGSEAFAESHIAKILFDKSVRFRLIEEYGPHCYDETDDGLLYTLDYSNEGYAYSWILSFGDKARVVEPQEMRDRFAEIARNLSAMYSVTEGDDV